MPTIYEVEGPDGSVFEIEGPDDATDEQVAAFAAQQFAAPRGSAGAAPEQVDSIPVPAGAGGTQPFRADVNALPKNQRRPDAMAALRGFGDTMMSGFADELGSVIESGQFSGPEYEAKMAENAALRAADDPNARAAGELLGFGGSMLAPVGALGRISGLGKQMLAGASIGAGTTALAGYGAAAPGAGAPTLEEDLILGGSIGGLAPLGAATLRKGAQILGVMPESAAVDALASSGLTPRDGSMQWLRDAAAQFYKDTGRGARISDLLPDGTAGRLSGPLSRSREAADRVIKDVRDSRAAATDTVPSRLNPDRAGETAIRLDTIKQGDADFGVFKNVERPLSEIDAVELSTKVLAPLGKTLPDAFLARLQERAASGKILGDDMDKIRRRLATLAGNPDPIKRAENEIVQNDFLEIYKSIFPEAGPAVERYAAGMAASEGSAFGTAAATRANSTATAEELAMMAEKTPAQLSGVAPGARQGLETAARSTFGESYRTAQRIEESPGYQDQIRQLVPEADAFIAGALADKRAIDNVAALAKIPKEKIADLGNDVDAIANAAAAAGLNVGGAFKAAVVRSILSKTLPVGEKAANQLANMLLDPLKRDDAIKALERAGLPKTGLREIMSGALIVAGRNTLTAPSDAAQPQE